MLFYRKCQVPMLKRLRGTKSAPHRSFAVVGTDARFPIQKWHQMCNFGIISEQPRFIFRSSCPTFWNPPFKFDFYDNLFSCSRIFLFCAFTLRLKNRCYSRTGTTPSSASTATNRYVRSRENSKDGVCRSRNESITG